MAPLFTLLVGTAATAGTATVAPVAATSGLIGAGGAVTAGGLMTAAGVGVGAMGALQQGQVAGIEGTSAQIAADYDAAVMEQEAKAKRAAGQFRQVRHEKESERKKSAAQAEGVSLLHEAELASELALEGLLIGYESEISAQRAESQAALDRLQGKLYSQKGKNLQTASYYKAGSTLLTGFGSAYT